MKMGDGKAGATNG
jgi:hypothetical protein